MFFPFKPLSYLKCACAIVLKAISNCLLSNIRAIVEADWRFKLCPPINRFLYQAILNHCFPVASILTHQVGSRLNRAITQWKILRRYCDIYRRLQVKSSLLLKYGGVKHWASRRNGAIQRNIDDPKKNFILDQNG
ncbi:hypothetical protein NPIL_153381 [Nephila pilipes]|uniref:Uncharacterized protein n=1 Tax=Nephila pilipes TaxID=299642 RepID=A0A8X6NLN6_NEPPI|nr:hypothetical protein NPIL_153381 [Nephila pilipes]